LKTVFKSKEGKPFNIFDRMELKRKIDIEEKN
jgi:hypothetical protein